ncbi:hypothetical protein HMPREF3221_00726 [Fusobacterium nucleatum]|uniref:Uncharacterized protein n=2 Tax=Fusobacterium nucleatum TaxID=851 RepID=A0A133P5J7_FUSNU|nr:hypothetical protein HMPREF3221_00726 [Fusobacterium nucleatum]
MYPLMAYKIRFYTELFRLLFINKDNKELQGDIVEYIKGKLNERKEKC